MYIESEIKRYGIGSESDSPVSGSGLKNMGWSAPEEAYVPS